MPRTYEEIAADYLAMSLAMEMSMDFTEYRNSGGRVHTAAECNTTRAAGAPSGCVIHNPTITRLHGCRQVMRSSTLIEDVCEHGTGHPNPDSARYLNWQRGYDLDRGAYFVHGCDGCCGPATAIQLQRWAHE